MTQQTFPFGEGTAPRVVISQVEGDLVVRAWDEQSIKIETGGRLSQLYQEGDTLVLARGDDDIDLWVPRNTSVSASDIDGDVSIEGILRVELTNINGDADIEDISEVVVLAHINADLSVSNTPELHARSHTGADVTLRSIGMADIEAVGSDLSIEEARTVVVGTVGSSLDADDITEALRVGNVGSDCQVQGSAHTGVTVGNVGADITVSGASTVQIGNVGASCEVSDVEGDVEIGFVGADVTVSGAGGNLHIGGAGADAELSGLQGNIEVGSVGSDLQLQAAFAPDSVARLNVGGDASIILPDEPNLSIQAAVGGDVSGRSIVSSGAGNVVTLVYGDGAAHLELNVGGDLDLRGGGSPRTSSSTSGSWKEFEREMANLGKEMSKMGQELGKEMSKMGQELGRDLGRAFGGTSAYGGEWANEVAHKVEERMRRAQQRAEEHARRNAERSRRYAEEQARRAEEKARRAREQGARLNVRINDREWRLGPDRLERIQEEARKAAAEGIAGAIEAVERAFSNLRIPTPPAPPAPPTSRPPSPAQPVSPIEPVEPGETVQREESEVGGGSQQTPQSQGTNEQAAPSAPVDPEKEREAILRMIAEGRITPEEGDLLLESLGG
ncbi:MAG TPA: hypothetical protein VKV40_21735 [Ktedonobacteraceae bacterium]|nr:hypothetical protein [Ktedonobacteraceae bacterium]